MILNCILVPILSCLSTSIPARSCKKLLHLDSRAQSKILIVRWYIILRWHRLFGIFPTDKKTYIKNSIRLRKTTYDMLFHFWCYFLIHRFKPFTKSTPCWINELHRKMVEIPLMLIQYCRKPHPNQIADMRRILAEHKTLNIPTFIITEYFSPRIFFTCHIFTLSILFCLNHYYPVNVFNPLIGTFCKRNC